MTSFLSRLAGRLAALVLAFALATPVAAQQRGTPGQFDFWVLALSWSPSWCEAEGDARRAAECARPFSFTVHGLWPQYQRGYPADCAGGPGPRPSDISGLLDIMPSPGLINYEWRKHGTCSGLTPTSYFNVLRKVFQTIRIPAAYRDLPSPRMVSPAEVEGAFRTANPGLHGEAISVTCDGRRLREVRICLTRGLDAFTACPEVERGSCRRDPVYMPSVRGG